MFQWSNIVWQQKLGAIQQQEDEMGRRFFLDMGPNGRNVSLFALWAMHFFLGTFEPQLPDQHWAYWANDAEIPTLHGGLNHVILFTANRNNARSRKVFPYEYPKFLFMDIYGVFSYEYP